MDDMFTDFVYRVKARARYYNTVRLNVLYSWIDKKFGAADRLTRKKDNNFQFASENSSEFQICGAIAEMLRADTCRIWSVEYSLGGKLSLIADYGLDEQHSNRSEILQALLDGEHSKILANPHYHPTSILYDSYQSGESKIEGRSKDDKYPSILVYPILANGRVLGLIDVNGEEKDQFRWVQQHELQDLCGYLANYLHREKLLMSMFSISGTLLKGSDFIDIKAASRIPRKVGDSICNAICDIFLCLAANIWIQDRSNSNKYILSGASLRNKLTKGLSVDNRGRIGVIVGQESRVSAPLISLLIENPKKKYVYGRYHKGSVTNYHDLDSIIVGDDFIECSDLRKKLFIDNALEEFMVFAVKERYDTADTQNPIGFITLHNSKIHGFESSWSSLVEMVGRRLYLDFRKTFFDQADQLTRIRYIQHEVRQDAHQIAMQAESFYKRHDFIYRLRRKFANLIPPPSSNEQPLTVFLKELSQASRQVEVEILGSGSLSQATSETLFTKALVANPNLRDDLAGLVRTEALARNVLDEMKERISDLERKIRLLDIGKNLSVVALFGDDSAGYLRNTPVEINLRDELIAILSQYRFPQSKGCYVEIKVEQDAIVKTFKKPFVNVLTNLIDNVYKHCSDNTHIEISWSSHKLIKGWGLAIKNIAPMNDAGFDPFIYGARGEFADDRTEGEGIGLWIVLQLCHYLGLHVIYDVHEIPNGLAYHTFTLREPT